MSDTVKTCGTCGWQRKGNCLATRRRLRANREGLIPEVACNLYHWKPIGSDASLRDQTIKNLFGDAKEYGDTKKPSPDIIPEETPSYSITDDETIAAEMDVEALKAINPPEVRHSTDTQANTTTKRPATTKSTTKKSVAKKPTAKKPATRKTPTKG